MALYRAIQRGELRAARLCSRLRIPRDAFDEWVARGAVRVERPIVEVRTVPAERGSFRTVRARDETTMSGERVERKDGSVVWRVRWRQPARAQSPRTQVRRRRLRRRARAPQAHGRARADDAGKESLADFGEQWWRLHAEPNLARSTLQVYAVQWDAHILPRLGELPLRKLTPDPVNRFRLELEADGVGPGSIRKSLTLLRGVMKRAYEWGRIPANPVHAVRKAPARRAPAVVPLPPELFESAVSFGAIEGTQTGRRRTVPLLGPVAQDLAERQLCTGRPAAARLVSPGHDGGSWTLTAYQNWRQRIYTAAATAAGVEHPRPYGGPDPQGPRGAARFRERQPTLSDAV